MLLQPVVLAGGLTLGLVVISRYNYLLFHSLAESFSFVVASALFVLAWNTWYVGQHGYLQCLGVAFLFVSGLDLLHTLAYKGMGVFPAYDADLPTQLWIAARMMEALSMLIAPTFLHRRLKRRWLIGTYAILTTVLVALIFARLFPHCYVEGVGLTPFKIVSEYVISAVLAAAIWRLYRHRRAFNVDVFPWMVAALIFTIISELAFTFYVGVYDLSNLVGHILKIFSVYCIYHAVVETGLRKPYALLFHDLQERNMQLAAEIVERKEAQHALLEQQAALAQSNANLEQFAYIASHDLQEPLRKIEAFADRLQRSYGENFDERGRHYLARMYHAATRMRDLIDDLLNYARVTTLARPFALVSLNAVMDEVIDDLYVRLEETGGHIEVGDLPTIEADALQMRRMFQNLVDNALKFHKPGEAPVVKVVGDMAERHNGWCRILVIDNGIGFDQTYAPQVFAPFKRLHGQDEYAGTGMGMAICRKIAERHGGYVEVNSEPDHGSTFTVILPTNQEKELS
jgi:signal transduction histidine kinase